MKNKWSMFLVLAVGIGAGIAISSCWPLKPPPAERSAIRTDQDLSAALKRLVMMYDYHEVHSRFGVSFLEAPGGHLKRNMELFQQYRELTEPIVLEYLESAKRPERVYYALQILEGIQSTAGEANAKLRLMDLKDRGLPNHESGPELRSLPLALGKYLHFCDPQKPGQR